MRVIVDVEGEVLEVELTRDGEKLFAEVGERKYELEATSPEREVWLFKHGTSVHEFTVLRDEDGSYSVSTSKDALKVSVSDPRKLSGSGGPGAAADGIAEIRTQMPGKVVKILVSADDEVASGDGVIVVEAMKMQNEIKSPKDGTVRDVRVSEGQTVNAGDVLVVIE